MFEERQKTEDNSKASSFIYRAHLLPKNLCKTLTHSLLCYECALIYRFIFIMTPGLIALFLFVFFFPLSIQFFHRQSVQLTDLVDVSDTR